MKIAVITITLNDDFKFNEWFTHYNEYKDEIFKHIIVDNGSSSDYLSKVKKTFIDSIIIERTTNGGCTIAYNDGIREALNDKEVDSIMLIGNDIKLPKNNLTILYNYLYSNKKLGMVSPVLLQKNSERIECYGCGLTIYEVIKMLDKGKKMANISQKERLVPLVLGGINLAKREFYEKVGLQDENLFMYGDEQDMCRRSEKAGFKMGATINAVAWHQHINPNSQKNRSIYASFLSARNYVYLLRKYDNIFKTICLFLFFFTLTTFRILRNPFNKESVRYFFASYKGIWYGLIGKMENKFL